MLFEKKPPVWEESGAEPGENLKKEGFKAGYKPPAAYFNWFFNGIYESVKEIQDKLAAELKKMAFKDTVGDTDITGVDGAKIKTGYVAPERIKTASQSANGLMAATDKKKLDGMEEGANNYKHPAAHPAAMVTEDATHRFVSDTDKNVWSSKAEKTAATQTANGLMAAADKKKLDGVGEGANNYVHPAAHPASMITPDSTHRFVTDAEKAVYTDKYTKNEVDNKFSTFETSIDWKESVTAFADLARTYPSPQDGWTVNVKDTDYTYRWSGTAWVAISANAIPLSTQSVDGKMSAADKKKLDGVAVGAEVNVQSDWGASDTASDTFIKNKPTKVSQFTNDSGFVAAAGGDVSNTKIATAENIATEFPVPAAGDAPKTFLGKMKKFTEDFRNLKTGLLTVGMR